MKIKPSSGTICACAQLIMPESNQQSQQPMPSLQNPTREFLSTNFHKTDLQQRCRELRLNKVLVNKEQLIDMIIANTPIANQNSDISPEPFPEVTPPGPSGGNSPPCASALLNPSTPAPTIPTLDEHQNTSSPSTHQVLTHPASPSAVVNESLWTNGVATVEQFQDQDETSTTENRKRSVEETITILVKKIETIMGKLQTKDMEIELLNEEVKIAYSKIGNPNQRISELEKSVNNKRQSSANHNTTPSGEERSLLLGDENLQRAAPSDLENCSIRTINGANIDLQNNLDPVSILDHLTELVEERKLKNNNMKIFISQLAPTILSEEFQARIDYFNEHLNDWGERNEISVLKTDLAFNLGTGEVDDMWYTLDKNLSKYVLNRYGVTRQCL